MQSNIELTFSHIVSREIIPGILVKDKVITTADTYLDHYLDQKLQGWMIVKKDANADIWESSTSNSFPEKQIILKSNATVTVSVWFF